MGEPPPVGRILPIRPDAETGAAGGASEELVELYRQHYPRLVRALELSGTERSWAEDLAQEAFARTLDHWWRVRHGANPPGYPYRIAFRLARRRLGRELLAGEALLATPSLADPAAEATTRVGVERALASMPPRRRSCAVLCLLAGLSVNEAAVALGIVPGTVRKQIERARADLHAALGDDAASADEREPGPVC